MWLLNTAPNYISSGYFPNTSFGITVNSLRNEDLELQTFSDMVFDLVIHLDVLEHVYAPFEALKEIFRTLKPGGYTIFTVPTEPGRIQSEQVAFQTIGGNPLIHGKPEYHGNPQRIDEMALVTWRYGYDFPFLIKELTGFNVEVRRFESKQIAVCGNMTEVYLCQRPKSTNIAP